MKAPHNEELPYSYCKLVEVSLKGSFADAANRRYMNFSELYKVGMKFEPNYQGMQSVDIQHDTNLVIFL